MADIDLAIFGRSWEEVMAYEAGIMLEYGYVDEKEYRERRKEVLTSFLNKPRIYQTDYFHQKYEVHAKENLKRLIEFL